MKKTRSFFLLSGLLVVIGLGVAVFFLVKSPAGIASEAGAVAEQSNVGDSAPFIIIPIIIVVTGLFMLPFLRIIFPKQIKNAVEAPATILTVRDTGVSINDNPQVGLTLEVTPYGGSPFQVDAKTIVSRLQTSLVQPGVKARVKYDALDPRHLQVLSMDLSDVAPASAEARMRELNNLREKNLITDEEYAKKRDEIIKSV